MGLNLQLEEKRERQKQAMARYMAKHGDRVRARAKELYWQKREAAKTDPLKAKALEIEMEKDRVLARARNKRNYYKNPDKNKAANKARYLAIKSDPVLWRKHLDRQKSGVVAWRKNNPEKRRAAQRRWENSEAGRVSSNASKIKSRKKNPEIALKHLVRCRINIALRKGYSKLRSTRESLGCSIPELKAHLESLFQPGMTWANRGEWEIDHIRPCASFNLLDPEQQRCCFHFTNLQPLWKAQNRQKGATWA